MAKKTFKTNVQIRNSSSILNLQQKNQELAQLLKNKPLTVKELNKIHQLTYTLENALEKINHDIKSIQISLERLHKASETNAPEKVKALGDSYLRRSMPLLQQR